MKAAFMVCILVVATLFVDTSLADDEVQSKNPFFFKKDKYY